MNLRRAAGLSLAVVALFDPTRSEAQKRPLDHADYDLWNRIQNQRLSPDGRFVTYQLVPGEGDGVVIVRDLRGDAELTLDRGADARFTGDSRYLVALVKPEEAAVEAWEELEGEDDAPPEPKDSLAVVDLGRLGQSDAVVSRVERVKSFKVPEDGDGWVAYLLEGEEEEGGNEPGGSGARRSGGGRPGAGAARGGRRPGAGSENGDDDEGTPRTDDGTTLVTYDPATGAEASFPNAVLFEFAEDGGALYFTASKKADSLSTGDDLDGVFSVGRGDSEAHPLATGEGRYLQLTISKDGGRVAVLTDRDDREAEEPAFALYLAESGGPASVAATSSTAGIPEGWWIPGHADVSFSDSGERLFFGTAPRPEPEPDEGIDPDEEVVVDIWNWRDPLLQPMQLVQRDDELRRTYDAMLVDGRVIQIESQDLQDVSFGGSKDFGVGLASNGLPYRQEVSWTGRFSDLVLVDAETGSRRVIAQHVGGGRASLSSDGRYVTWWDGPSLAWMVFDIEAGEARNVTDAVGVPVYNELDDHPADPPPYGTAGWTENDEDLLVYDRFDIWAVDPTGREAPRNVTEGVGRANDVRFRLARPTEAGQGGGFRRFGGGGGGAQEAIPVDEDVLLSSFHLFTKQGGFYRDRFDRDREPERMVTEDASFGRPQKAEDADVLLFTRETFRDFPNLYVSSMSFRDARMISDANPQQEDYTWGTADLVSWNSNDGVPLQGILYKPDDFDPSRKYPMMVYFYERNSDGLHRYTVPAAGSSSINRSFYVSRGYLLFVPDIPYIDGYPGESALDAVVPGVLAMVDQGFVDRDKIGVQGHSWGGYQIAYMITRTDLFAAAEAGAPVANMTSAYGGVRWQSGMSRAFQYETGQSRIGGSLWETPLRYLENSALFTADKINTPLLMMHNDEDGAVPWYQGIEMFSAMRRLGKPVWMLNYNGEPHGLRKRQNQKDWAIRMQQFFDHYLKDAPPAVWMIDGVPATEKGKTLGLELLRKKPIS
jgi:dipeptidyl aminopeptidase/acylaminoacyl peptidase